MKLILCCECQDVVKLLTASRTCHCGKSGGYYLPNDLDAVVTGPCVPIGFDNRSLGRALQNRPESGAGERFEAFVIPRECPTIEVREGIGTSQSAATDVPSGEEVAVLRQLEEDAKLRDRIALALIVGKDFIHEIDELFTIRISGSKETVPMVWVILKTSLKSPSIESRYVHFTAVCHAVRELEQKQKDIVRGERLRALRTEADQNTRPRAKELGIAPTLLSWLEIGHVPDEHRETAERIYREVLG